MPVIPFTATHIIAAVKYLRKLYPSEVGDSKKCRGFHLHCQTSFGLPTLHFGRCFTIDSISSPGLGKHILYIMGLENCFQHSNPFRACADLTTRRKVVV